MSELLKRIMVGAIGIPLALVVIYAGSYYYFISIFLISLICLWEFFQLIKAKEFNPLVWAAMFVTGTFEVLIFYGVYSSSIFQNFHSLQLSLILVLLSFLILFGLNLFTNKENQIANISITFGGLIFILVPFISLIVIRYTFWKNTDIPAFFIITYFASIWICDSAAYFIGRKWGKTKIAPKISPKKSWEGGIAGFAAACLSFLILGILFKLPLINWQLLLFGAVVGSAGQIGDFLESSFKRDANVKDSSKLLSEHGGMLDRFDSIMYTAPAILLLLFLFV